jgi:glycosyltransferase involved in cell wall biosynthesis
MSKTTVVIPCYNEAKRLNIVDLQTLLEVPDLQITFVNDGSTDDTLKILQNINQRFLGRVDVVHLAENRGKAEAVRAGLLRGCQMGSEIVGFCDADFATPPEEIIRLIQILKMHPERHCLIGARVRLLGLNIHRSFLRHLLGRVFATFASWVLQLTVYDTQCGAKFFRNSNLFRRVLQVPFCSRWAFDIELLGRLHSGTVDDAALEEQDFLEVSLQTWNEIAGSKVTMKSALRMGFDLIRIRRHLKKFPKLQHFERP